MRSNDTLMAGCAVFACVLVVSGLVCGGCLFSGVTGMSKAIDAAAEASKRQVEAEQKQRAKPAPPVRR